MSEAKQAQLALLKQLHEQGVLSAEQYRAQIAALEGNIATFDQREQRVQQQRNVAGDYISRQAAQWRFGGGPDDATHTRILDVL